jgi:hypothetical protein
MARAARPDLQPHPPGAPLPRADRRPERHGAADPRPRNGPPRPPSQVVAVVVKPLRRGLIRRLVVGAPAPRGPALHRRNQGDALRER